MNNPDELPEEDKLISMAAAEWIVRRDSGFNPADQDRYFEWLAADPRHGEWVVRHQKTWQRFDPLLGEQESASADGLFPPPASKESSHTPAVPPERTWLAPAGWAIAAVLVCVAFLSFNSDGGVKSGALAPSAVSSTTPQSEHRLLDDGSMVELNRGAAIAVDFSAGMRRVRLLQGEAYFTVAHDASRPFVVQAKEVNARALGTVFNVRLENDTIEVLVTEGRVHVEKAEAGDAPALRSPAAPAAQQPAAEKASTPAQVVLLAGQRAVVGLQPEDEPIQVLKVSANDMERLLSWQTRLLDFSSAPLAEVVAEFNRHNLSKLVIADDSLNALPIVASFRADNVEGFLRLLEITADVKVDRHPDRIVLRRSR